VARRQKTDQHADPDQLPEITGYEVVDLIDEGGFSKVYRARQLDLDRLVAIKVLNESFTDERQRRAFTRECTLLGPISGHPNIVTVHHATTTSLDRPAIVMELYAGTYRNVGRLPIAEVVDVGAKISAALQHVHERQIVHGDLKPHNIFLSTHGEPALADFGISYIAGDSTTGTRFTLKYAPPEMLRDGVSDERGDIYSLGATIHQLATGAAPFAADADAELVQQIMTAPPPGLLRSDAPPELGDLLERCLAKRPEDRPRTAAQLAGDFRRLKSLVGEPPGHETAGGRVLTPRPARPDPVADNAAGPRGSGGDLTTTDDRFERLQTRRPKKGSAESSSPATVSKPNGPTRVIAATAGVVVVLAVAAIVLLRSGGQESSAPTTIAAPPTTAAAEAFEVLTPPGDFTVEATAEGLAFEWSGSELGEAGGKVQLHRIGSNDNVVAATAPFVWDLDIEPGASACFEIRAVNDAETRLSQSATGPVCVTPR
jgi:serine/threonine protein kinase